MPKRLNGFHHPAKKFALPIAIIVLLIVALAVFINQPAAAQTDEELAAKFAPLLQFAGGEQFYPTSVDYIIDNSALKQRHPNGSSTLIDPEPRPDNLGINTTPDMFLDNKLGTFESIAADYQARADELGYYTYIHVVRNQTSVVVQYWLFYVYNNGPLNDHQGDIETVTVFADATGNAQWVVVSQHNSGQNAAWADVEKDGNHPVIYVAQGSHANYFRSYQGKFGLENDEVGADGKTITLNQLNLVLLGEPLNHPPEQSWLDFQGRWGYVGTDEEIVLGRAGPFGPVFSRNGVKWSEPDQFLASTFRVDGNYFVLAWLVANFLLLYLIYFLARFGWKSWNIIRFYRRHHRLLVGKFLASRGGKGFVIGLFAILVAFLGLLLPWYGITAFPETKPLSEAGIPLMTVDGVQGVRVNLFLGDSSAESTSGFRTLFATRLPLALIFAAELFLLSLDVIGVRSGRALGRKFIVSTVTILLPVFLILIFISQLSALVPLALQQTPTVEITESIQALVQTISANPAYGTASMWFPIIGTSTVWWGLSVGSYLLIAAALLSLISGIVMHSAPDLEPKQD